MRGGRRGSVRRQRGRTSCPTTIRAASATMAPARAAVSTSTEPGVEAQDVVVPGADEESAHRARRGHPAPRPARPPRQHRRQAGTEPRRSRHHLPPARRRPIRRAPRSARPPRPRVAPRRLRLPPRRARPSASSPIAIARARCAIRNFTRRQGSLPRPVADAGKGRPRRRQFASQARSTWKRSARRPPDRRCADR